MTEVFKVFHPKTGGYYTHLGESKSILSPVDGIADPIISECAMIGKAKFTEGNKQEVWVFKHQATDQYYHVGAGLDLLEDMVFYTDSVGHHYLRPLGMFWEPVDLGMTGTWPRFMKVEDDPVR